MLTYTYKGLNIKQFVAVLQRVTSCYYNPPTLTHISDILGAEYNALQTIESNINVPTDTKYFAGKSIILGPGFSAGSNENFLAEIKTCESLPNMD